MSLGSTGSGFPHFLGLLVRFSAGFMSPNYMGRGDFLAAMTMDCQETYYLFEEVEVNLCTWRTLTRLEI